MRRQYIFKESGRCLVAAGCPPPPSPTSAPLSVPTPGQRLPDLRLFSQLSSTNGCSSSSCPSALAVVVGTGYHWTLSPCCLVLSLVPESPFITTCGLTVSSALSWNVTELLYDGKVEFLFVCLFVCPVLASYRL